MVVRDGEKLLDFLNFILKAELSGLVYRLDVGFESLSDRVKSGD